MLYGRYTDKDLELDDEQKALYPRLTAQQDYASKGSLAGSVLGGAAGAAAGLISGGSLSMPMMMAGASMGGAAGNAIGSFWGGNVQNEAEQRIRMLEEDRQKKLLDRQRRQSAVSELLGHLLPQGM